MHRKPHHRFLTRWLVSSLGLWIAAGFLNQSVSYGNRIQVIIVAGLLLAVINTLLKPILIIFSLPALLFTLGLFVIFINGLIVYLVSKLYTPLHITNYWAAVGVGMIIGLVNYLVNEILERR